MATTQEIADRKNFRRRTLSVVFVILAVAVVLWLIFTLSDIIFMVFVAIFLSVALVPPVHFLAKRG
ncbi:MAG: hypothetical protein O6834_09170, partial [Actinobacteria bacterium]|nr:hypothetical protein [Actinomycetota bacterium]